VQVLVKEIFQSGILELHGMSCRGGSYCSRFYSTLKGFLVHRVRFWPCSETPSEGISAYVGYRSL